MNPKMLLKAVFLLLVLLVLVLMGLNNGETVTFRLPPLIHKLALKAAIMYFAFLPSDFSPPRFFWLAAAKRGSAKPAKSGK